MVQDKGWRANSNNKILNAKEFMQRGERDIDIGNARAGARETWAEEWNR